MTEERNYDSVADLLEDIIDDDGAFASEVQQAIESQRLAAALFQMRNNVGLTQEEVARRMGRTQSSISKLEHSTTDRISVRDLEEYASAIDVNLVISFEKQMTAADRVKFYFFEIKKHLDEMRELAGDDPDIVAGVDKFYNEWLINTLRHFSDGKKQLSEAKQPNESPERMRIVGPKGPPDLEEMRRLLENMTS